MSRQSTVEIKDGVITKFCPMCLIRKPIDQFYASNKIESIEGLHSRCKSCDVKYARARELKNKYKITEEVYQNMINLQNGLCAICKEKPKYNGFHKNNLLIDHNHRTGKIRKLLCDKCNKGLGNFKDSIELLIAAAEYLLERK